MKYKVIEKVNPRDPKGPKKRYASPVKAGNLTLKDLAKEIAANSSLSRGDVENVLINFVEQMPVFLKIGMSVKLGDFGTIRLSLRSEGVDEADRFDVSKIKGVKIIFTPSRELKKSLEDITFEESK